ncbi:polyketide biosynthesis acyl carrier protein [Amycolatopsis arida]|uniref:Polyketide biosynthesis acyl carrier protein n=1 Tax=Amycolatopsis arida TaxID=587909 RepID=A0A1I6AK74_9PSEU|nr:phosphopantetheine-binding protein [Amycolatopsis arida]TDX87346.1 polyketide biosynthesis acyl carrier protein [Amycolatopsis arida]SFQ69131.1 polyketide biosynthesis acyl carrier protein [Amycolatopsis arida]
MTGRDEVLAVVRAQIRAVCPEVDPAAIRPDRSMRELGCDSLDRLDVVVGTLDALGLELRPDTFAGVRDIGGLVDALVAELGRAGTPGGRRG